MGKAALPFKVREGYRLGEWKVFVKVFWEVLAKFAHNTRISRVGNLLWDDRS